MAAGLSWLYWEVTPSADPHVSTSCVLLRAPPELRHALFPFAVGRRLRGGRRGRLLVEHAARGRSERAERTCGVPLSGISAVKARAIYSTYFQWNRQRSSYANIRVRVLTITPQHRAAKLCCGTLRGTSASVACLARSEAARGLFAYLVRSYPLLFHSASVFTP